MGRQREFDREAALGAAIQVFADDGFEGSSTEALLEAMKISRQSMYDTFGDKRSLYLQALKQYHADSMASLLHLIHGASSPLEGIKAALLSFTARTAPNAALGCLGVSAVCEFGRSDAEVCAVTDLLGQTLSATLERQLEAARKAGEVARDLDVRAAAQFLGSTLSGMRVSARAGAPPETLRAIALMAIRSLR